MDERPQQEAIRYAEIAPRPPEGPLDLRSVIGGTGPLELDIGFGRGMSLFHRAQVAPQSRLLGIEIKSKWAYKVSQRAEREGLSQIAVWAADAREVLARSGPEGCIARAFVHFPDPWWKKKHTKRRVVSEPFLDALAAILGDGAELFIQTDVEDRAALYRDLVAEHQAFALQSPPEVNPFGCISNRERRAVEDGLPIYRVLATRSRR